MKTTKLILSGLLMFGALVITQAQTITTTSDVTRVGTQSADYGTGNAFFGYRAGIQPLLTSPTGNYNTYLGNMAGYGTNGSNNVFIGYNSGVKPQIKPNTVPGTGNVFIGANTGLTVPDGMLILPEKYSNKLIIDNSATTTPLIWGDFAEDQLKFNGKVGIGNGFGNFPTEAGTVDVEDYSLFVYGGILTEEVRVMLEGDWADYVFEADYDLPKLEEVEQFIKTNKHLPNVPSAKEVKENGIELGKITIIQQEKIEELTLYAIEQNKLNKEQTKQLKKQQSEIDALKEQVKLLLENQK